MNLDAADFQVIRHPPRHFHFTLTRRFEIERDCPHCPDGLPDAASLCPDCGCLMCYRGRARLRNGTLVHYFECVHSPREVHSVSVVISE
jgi:hypothetical protein